MTPTAGMPVPYSTAIPMMAVRSMSSAISSDSPLQTGNTEESRSCEDDIYSNAESINVVTPRQGPTAGGDMFGSINTPMGITMGDEHEMNLEESNENSFNEMYGTNRVRSVDVNENALPIVNRTAGNDSDEEDNGALYGKGKGNTAQ